MPRTAAAGGGGVDAPPAHYAARMVQTLLAAAIAPLLAAAATVAARRWGPRTGGIVSAFPAIVGPVLLVVELQHGAAFAARAAAGTLLGLAALAAFSLAYARAVAAGRGWGSALLVGWAAAAVASGSAGALGGRAGAGVGLAVAAGSLVLAHRALPRTAAAPPAEPRTSIPARMALTAVLVLVLSAAAGALGPVAGGLLAALPVLTSILTVLTHRETGPAAAVALLRGTLTGMGGFVAFCALAAVLLADGTVAPAFVAATAAAVAVQAVAATWRPRLRATT